MKRNKKTERIFRLHKKSFGARGRKLIRIAGEIDSEFVKQFCCRNPAKGVLDKSYILWDVYDRMKNELKTIENRALRTEMEKAISYFENTLAILPGSPIKKDLLECLFE